MPTYTLTRSYSSPRPLETNEIDAVARIVERATLAAIRAMTGRHVDAAELAALQALSGEPLTIAAPADPDDYTPNPYAPRFPLWGSRPDGLGATWSVEINVLPGMCPYTRNPHGGRLRLTLPTERGVPELAAVAGCARAAMAELVGGWAGDAATPPVDSMEGAVAHVARRVAALFGCPVTAEADLRVVPPAGDPTAITMRFAVTVQS